MLEDIRQGKRFCPRARLDDRFLKDGFRPASIPGAAQSAISSAQALLVAQGLLVAKALLPAKGMPLNFWAARSFSMPTEDGDNDV
ncbi:hypothetical protein KUL72_21170 [Bradyrhizobium arachidis]|uniref:hypothetical protein n=1 Tax=Bradyrhizobium arachidis TaxID=858423 RepID=UPI002163A63D|nr:hypothetical protein [Bradyrhizobium arachidis]UVO34024.1 hypothetical protein KUL72_21170 [Bradyrhizobium arachidis]